MSVVPFCDAVIATEPVGWFPCPCETGLTVTVTGVACPTDTGGRGLMLVVVVAVVTTSFWTPLTAEAYEVSPDTFPAPWNVACTV